VTTLFVTSSGTGIGKTHMCCELLKAAPPDLRIRCVKPVISGFAEDDPAPSDTARLLEASSEQVTPKSIRATSPWRFRLPLSADRAAAAEGRTIPFDELVSFSRDPEGVELNLVEGIGGVMAPIDDSNTVIDWIAALSPQLLLVVGSYLGALSHALTAVSVLGQRQLNPLAIVVSQSLTEPMPTTDTVASLEQHCRNIPVLLLRRNNGADAARASAFVFKKLGSG
jgi:dethiobiotin synthetase